jgi:hypothetical protein
VADVGSAASQWPGQRGVEGATAAGERAVDPGDTGVLTVERSRPRCARKARPVSWWGNAEWGSAWG